MDMKLYFYYSNSCGSCKDYEEVVDRLSIALKTEAEKRNIKGELGHNIKGVPAIILEDNNGNVIYESVGNLPYDIIIDEIEKIDDK
jgi:glutaredoxin-related protein